jgi:golgi-specific brefeldin A-resistance guanine nucleotide exchange factor 1
MATQHSLPLAPTSHPRPTSPLPPPSATVVPVALTRGARISIAVDPVALVVTECITVTSAMRKHARWAHSSVSAILGGGSSKYASSIDTGGRKLPQGQGDEDEGSLGGRWGLRGKKGKSLLDNPLMSAFTRLRSELKGVEGM